MPDGQGFVMPEPSWDLRIFVPDLQVERSLRVRGDMHIGGVMLKLVEELDISIDWSDHALWWPKKNCWLTKTRQTLNHYGVQADSYLNFTPMHKPLRVQLPDLRYVDARVDFSVPCSKAVMLLCKELGIRHSEELSFCRPLGPEHLKKNYQNVGVTPKQRGYVQTSNQQPTSSISASHTNTYGAMRSVGPTDTLNGKASPYVASSQPGTIDTRSHSPDITSTLSRHASYRGFTSTYSTNMLAEDLKNLEISNSPHSPSADAKSSLLYPKSLAEKARLNAGWLDSHLSLYQQQVCDYDTLQLRFKYREFYDLNPKLDMARINQIYEQAKWSLLTGEIGCTENEMMMFSGLQYQIQQQASNPIPDDIDYTNDDIDAALTELQLQLEGGTTSVYDRTAAYNVQSSYQTYGTQGSRGPVAGGRSPATRILETHSNVKHQSATELKLNYIKAWRALPEFGVHLFVVQFGGSNKEEILGIACDRLIRIDPSNGNHLRVWPFSKMKTWRVNWDSRTVLIQSEDGEMSFSCLSADCKIPHEFIGGYVFLSMRSKDNNQTLNEDLFYKLTHGWDD
jgi:hypothetical protein